MRERRIIFSSLLILIFLGLISAKAGAEDRYPLTFARKTEKPVVIDGVLNEECWKKALKTGPFVEIYDNTREAYPQTFFRVVYDKEGIYFGIQAEEPATSKLIFKKIAHDTWPVGVSSIELFLDTNHDGHTYYHLAANLLGNRYDEYITDLLQLKNASIPLIITYEGTAILWHQESLLSSSSLLIKVMALSEA